MPKFIILKCEKCGRSMSAYKNSKICSTCSVSRFNRTQYDYSNNAKNEDDIVWNILGTKGTNTQEELRKMLGYPPVKDVISYEDN